GETPILTLPPPRDRLAAISGVTKRGRLCLRARDAAVRGPDRVASLRPLARPVRGPLPAIRDGAAIHRARPVKGSLRTGAGRRFRPEALPGDAPGPNPDEGIRRYLERVALRNVPCSDVDHPHDERTRAAKRPRRTPHAARHPR